MQRVFPSLFAIVALAFAASFTFAEVYIDPDRAVAESADYRVQGEYVGELETENGSVRIAAQVKAHGDDRFSALGYQGGLPGDGWDGEEPAANEACRDDDGEIVFRDADMSITARYEEERGFIVSHDEQGDLGVLAPVHRVSPDAGKEPPDGAVVLFDGTSLDKWRSGASMTDEGLLTQGATSTVEFESATIHIEFKPGFMPTHSGQGRANSGAYIQRRYEVQILDSFAEPSTINGNASLYNERAPDINMSYPPLQWQTYTIDFTAPQFDDDGNKTANARFTVVHNGEVVHDDVELEHGTGAGRQRGEGGPGPLYLQDHGGDPIRFRNVWIKKK